VTACAVCDGAAPIFRHRPLFVIGGGDSAVEEATFLTKFGSHVYLVHRRGELRASKIMQQRALSHPKITVLWHSEIIRIEGDSVVRRVVIRNNQSLEETSHEAGGVFFAVGHTPNTAFLKGQLELEPTGYIKVI
jgi:thioredoxin reductase (NADPH)